MKGYPNWFLPGLILVMALMISTGLLLAPTTLVMRINLDLPWRLPSAYRIICAAAHATGGFSILLLVGSLWNMHMRSGWRRNQQRTSGMIVCGLILLLGASAIPLYYASDEAFGNAASLVHLAAGSALTASFGWHWWYGRKKRLNHQPAYPNPESTSRVAAQYGIR